MACLDRSDRILIVSALMFMVGYTLDKTYGESWHKAIKLSWFTKLLYYMDFQPWEYTEHVLNQQEALTYGWETLMLYFPTD